MLRKLESISSTAVLLREMDSKIFLILNGMVGAVIKEVG